MWPARKLKHVALAEKLEIVKIDRDQAAQERDQAVEDLEGQIDYSQFTMAMYRRACADRDALIEWLILHGEKREQIESFLAGIRKHPMEKPLP